MISIFGSKDSKVAVWIVFIFLFMVLLPLFVIAHFNYPCSDDFAYAGAIYTGIKNGNSLRQIIAGCWETAMRYYHVWQGRYFDDVVSAFGVGTAVPEYYFLGTYLTLILFVIACVGFVRTITHRLCGWDSDISWIVSMLLTAMLVLYVPYPSEALYWYVGATGYTMAYALLLFLGQALVVFYTAEKGCFYEKCSWGLSEHRGSDEETKFMHQKKNTKIRKVLSGVLAVILTAMVGGSNYSTGLLTAEMLVLVCGLMLILKRKCGFLLFILVEYLICFVKWNALSPGNNARMGNVESLGVVGSILASLHQGAVFLREWFRFPVFLFIVVVLLLGTYQVAKMAYSFRLPALVTVISFGLYSSMMTPAFFAGATWGPGRLINLVYFSYYFFLAGNLLYWMGWAVHKYEKLRQIAGRQMKISPVLFCFFALFLVSLKIYGLQSTNSSSALLSLVKGEAEEYLRENEKRWESFSDDSVRDVVVEEFSVKPYVLYHDDIVEDQSDWRNSTVAGFFGKDSVRLNKMD